VRVISFKISPDVYHLININVSFHHLCLLSPAPLDGVVSIGKNSATPLPGPRFWPPLPARTREGRASVLNKSPIFAALHTILRHNGVKI